MRRHSAESWRRLTAVALGIAVCAGGVAKSTFELPGVRLVERHPARFPIQRVDLDERDSESVREAGRERALPRAATPHHLDALTYRRTIIVGHSVSLSPDVRPAQWRGRGGALPGAPGWQAPPRGPR